MIDGVFHVDADVISRRESLRHVLTVTLDLSEVIGGYNTAVTVLRDKKIGEVIE